MLREPLPVDELSSFVGLFLLFCALLTQCQRLVSREEEVGRIYLILTRDQKHVTQGNVLYTYLLFGSHLSVPSSTFSFACVFLLRDRVLDLG